VACRFRRPVSPAQLDGPLAFGVPGIGKTRQDDTRPVCRGCWWSTVPVWRWLRRLCAGRLAVACREHTSNQDMVRLLLELRSYCSELAMCEWVRPPTPVGWSSG
jgi:hypothetical protein